MRLFLAGVSTSNLGALFKHYSTLVSKGEEERSTGYEARLRDFLQGCEPPVGFPRWEQLNVLESYFYCQKNAYLPRLLPLCRNFLLDSGAFSFMQGQKTSVDWDRYANEYADFILEHDIKNYFELDIDAIVGLDRVEKLRDLIERRTGRKSMPVWHVERGKDYYEQMTREYDYIGLGSIAKVTGGRIKIDKRYFPWFVNVARENGCKVHALGYTPNDLHGAGFFSVDSTSWLYGNMTGSVCLFDTKAGVMTSHSKVGHRLKGTGRQAAAHNLVEWYKYMRYAERYL